MHLNTVTDALKGKVLYSVQGSTPKGDEGL